MRFLLFLVNFLNWLKFTRCFECGKKLKLIVVKKNGESSIECACCWKLSLSHD